MSESHDTLTPNEYQARAILTMNQEFDEKDMLINSVMGMCGEAGECIDLVKKHVHQGHEFDRYHFARELGDVCWYIAEAAYAAGYDFEDILRMNLDKLAKRFPEGEFSVSDSVERDFDDI